MPLDPLDLKESSSIAAAAYDRGKRTLRVTFKAGKASHRGGTYDYLGVPADTIAEFLKADSLGRFVNWRIKPHHEYKKVS